MGCDSSFSASFYSEPDEYTPTRDEIIGAAVSWFYEYGIDGVDLSDADIEAMVKRGLTTEPNGGES